MAETNEFTIQFSEETVFAETPNNPDMDEIRVTGESLKGNKNTIKNPEITAGRRPKDHFKVSEGGSGTLSGLLSHNNWKKILAGALAGTWVEVNIAANTISAAAADNSYNGSGGNEFANVVAGQLLLIGGFDGNGGANNGVVRVTSKPNNGKIIVASTGNYAKTVEEELAGDNVTIKGEMLRDGNTKKSFLFQKGFPDSSDTTHLSYRGCRVGAFRLNIETEQPVTVEADIEAEGEYSGTASLDATPNAAPTGTPFIAGLNVGTLREAGAALSSACRSASVEVQNNLERQMDISSIKATDIHMGDSDVNGAFEIYFKSKTLHDKFLNHTESDLLLPLTDAAGNYFIVSIPALYYNDSAVQASGRNQRVMDPLSWVAKENSGATHQIQIDVLPVA